MENIPMLIENEEENIVYNGMTTQDIIYSMYVLNKTRFSKKLSLDEFIYITKKIDEILGLKCYMMYEHERLTYNFLYINFYHKGENGTINEHRELKKVSLIVIDKCRTYFYNYVKKLKKIDEFNNSFDENDKIRY